MVHFFRKILDKIESITNRADRVNATNPEEKTQTLPYVIPSLKNLNVDFALLAPSSRTSDQIQHCNRKINNSSASITFVMKPIKELNEQLMDAAKLGDVAAINALVKKNVDLNIVDDKGNTAAHYAVKYKCDEVLKFLAKKGAIDVCNRQGEMPFDKVRKSNLLLAQDLIDIICNGLAEKIKEEKPQKEIFVHLERIMHVCGFSNVKPADLPKEWYLHTLNFSILEQNHKATQALIKIYSDVFKKKNNINENSANTKEIFDSSEKWYKRNILMFYQAFADKNYEALQELIKINANDICASKNVNENQKNIAELAPLSEEEYVKKLKELKILIHSTIKKYVDRDDVDQDIKSIHHIIEECASVINASENKINENFIFKHQKSEEPINRHLKTLFLLHLAIERNNEKAIVLLIKMCNKYRFDAEDIKYFSYEEKDKDLDLFKFIISQKYYEVIPILYQGIQKEEIEARKTLREAMKVKKSA